MISTHLHIHTGTVFNGTKRKYYENAKIDEQILGTFPIVKTSLRFTLIGSSLYLSACYVTYLILKYQLQS